MCPFSKSDCDTGEYGFIDTTGKEVIPQIYDSLGCWSEGLCSVKKDGKSGASTKQVQKLFLSDFMILFGLSVKDYVGSEKVINGDSSTKQEFLPFHHLSFSQL